MTPTMSHLSRVLGIALAVVAPLAAQPSPTARALMSWIALDAPPADAARAGAALQQRDPRWRSDAQGNLVLRVGSGSPRRVFACGLDRVGYVVSAITDAGYLRLHRSGNAALHPLWDQFHQAQQVYVNTATVEVPGVVAVPNGHFARQHRGDTTVVGVDDLWVDIGARSAAEVQALGVALMDPVTRDVPPWPIAGAVAGPDASGRAGCAAVAAAATATPSQGENIFVLSTLRGLRWAGLNATLARLGAVDQITIVGPAGRRNASGGAIDVRLAGRPADLPAATRDSVTMVAVRARHTGSLVETVAESDADTLRAFVATLAGVAPSEARWMDPAGSGRMQRAAERQDSLTGVAELLRQLADLPGVPMHEFRVRDAVRDALPGWARVRATTDSLGNLLVAVGPARDTTVVVAHLDEVSFTVDSIRGDGRVTLTPRGGVIPSAWEGQPALLHFDPVNAAPAAASVRGIFVPRDSAAVRTPAGQLTAWFGLDSATLVSRGVKRGLGVTAYKRAQRMGVTRFTGRSMDDRAGSTALLLAIRALDTARLDHTVLFVWSVAEEGGLVGASAVAKRLGATVRRAYAIDTFVSSDTPLELPTFAYVPLGNGPVLRALDDGSISSRAERARVQRAAQNAHVPLQVGTTHGSTDGTAFMVWGAVGSGLSWPGRYSHSPAEVLDLRDLTALGKLIHAAVSASSRE